MTITTTDIGPRSPHDDNGHHPDGAFAPRAIAARADARLYFARNAERAATTLNVALAAELDDARATIISLEGTVDHYAAVLTGRERYIAVLQGRWRRVRAGRSPLGRLARLARRWGRSLRRSVARHPSLTRLVVATVLVLAIIGMQRWPGW